MAARKAYICIVTQQECTAHAQTHLNLIAAGAEGLQRSPEQAGILHKPASDDTLAHHFSYTEPDTSPPHDQTWHGSVGAGPWQAFASGQ